MNTIVKLLKRGTNFQFKILRDLIKGYGVSNGYEMNYFVGNLSKEIAKLRKYGLIITCKKGNSIFKKDYLYKLSEESIEKAKELLQDEELTSSLYNILGDLIRPEKRVYAEYSNPYECKNVLAVIRRLEKKGLKFKRKWVTNDTNNRKHIEVFLVLTEENKLLAKQLLEQFKR